MYTGSTTASFTRAQLNNWEGFQPSKDWAIFFELRRPSSDIALITLHDGTNQGHFSFCRSGSIHYGGNGTKINLNWCIGGLALYFSGPILNSDEYLQVLISYNKTGYEAGGGGTEPDVTGLSYYYRQSSTSTFNNSWIHATPSSLFDNLDESAIVPSDYTTYFGRNYNSTTGLDGNGYLTNIKLWNQTLSTSDL